MRNLWSTLVKVLVGTGLLSMLLPRKDQSQGASGAPRPSAPPAPGAGGTRPQPTPARPVPPATAPGAASQTRSATLTRELRVNGRIVPAGTPVTILSEHGRGSAYDVELRAPDRCTLTVEGAAIRAG